MPAPTRRQVLLGIVAAALLMGFVLGSRLIARPSPGSSNIMPASSFEPYPIVFAPSISYSRAIELITDMGLQPSLMPCAAGRNYTPGSGSPQAVWQPVGQRGTFSQTRQIFVNATFSAPYDWRLQLTKIPGVRLGHYQPLICSRVIFGTPPPGTNIPLNPSEAGTYVRVTFSPSQAYDLALYTILNLGLGLVNICYEQSRLASDKGTEPQWRFVGQEHQFAQTHELLMETEESVTSSLWQTQLQSRPGVVSIDVPYKPMC